MCTSRHISNNETQIYWYSPTNQVPPLPAHRCTVSESYKYMHPNGQTQQLIRIGSCVACGVVILTGISLQSHELFIIRALWNSGRDCVHPQCLCFIFNAQLGQKALKLCNACKLWSIRPHYMPLKVWYCEGRKVAQCEYGWKRAHSLTLET